MTSSQSSTPEVKPGLDFNEDELVETHGTEVIRQALRPRRMGEPKRLASRRQPAVNPRSTSPLRLRPYLGVKGSTVSTNVPRQLYLEEA